VVEDADLDSPRDAVLAGLADEMVGLWLSVGIAVPDEWLHRRVETISFVDTVTVRRKVSLDLTLGRHTPEMKVGSVAVRLVALALFEKRTLTSLDVFDEAGRTLPVLTTRQNGALAGHILCTVAKAMARDADTTAIVEDLRAIAALPSDKAEARRQTLVARLEGLPAGDPLLVLSTSDVFKDFLRSFARNFILVTLVPGTAGTRRVLKFAYHSPVEEVALGWRTRAAKAMGWQAREYNLGLPGLVNCESYHVEIEVPDGVSVDGAVLFERGLEDTNAEEIPDDHLGAFARSGSSSVHFHASSKGNENAEVRLWVRIAREGWLTAAALATVGVAVVAVANAAFLHRLLEPPGKQGSVSTDVAALLMGLVAVLASFAVRVGEHPVTSRAVFGVRLVAMLSVATPLAAGWVLAFGPKGKALEAVWWGLAVFALICAGLGIAAWVGPRSVTPEA
jgi:hypothetical protein